MSYGIAIPASLPPGANPAFARGDFAAEAEKVINDYHAYDSNPDMAAKVRSHMLAGAEAASAIMANLKGDTFSVVISGHVHGKDDSLDWQQVGVTARSEAPIAKEEEQEAISGA
jgi:hypothetical protein